MGMNLGDSDELNSEINITPFVDVMLVLLVIFMVTAPLVNRAADLDLPKTALKKTVDGDEPILFIDKHGQLKIGDKTPTYETLVKTLQEDDKVQSMGILNIAAHNNLRYEYVYRAMELANRAGVSKVQLEGEASLEQELRDLDTETKKSLGGKAGPPGQ